MVYCASVPNQTLITRRNGSVLISGNCVEYLGEYVATRFRDGTAYITPEKARGRGSMAFHAAQMIISEIEKQDKGGYAHFGPGAAA